MPLFLIPYEVPPPEAVEEIVPVLVNELTTPLLVTLMPFALPPPVFEEVNVPLFKIATEPPTLIPVADPLPLLKLDIVPALVKEPIFVFLAMEIAVAVPEPELLTEILPSLLFRKLLAL